MKTLTKKFLRENKGVTALEYGMIAGLISVAIAVSVTGIATRLGVLFGNILTGIGG
jgi:pilus assembly protein Flp/PilA